MHFTYITYSPTIDRFYVGESDDVNQRLQLHNNGHFKGAYTAQAHDWILKLAIPCRDRHHALLVEKTIKRRKSRKYIVNLIRYDELVLKLVDKF
jgi:putative endonuclease